MTNDDGYNLGIEIMFNLPDREKTNECGFNSHEVLEGLRQLLALSRYQWYLHISDIRKVAQSVLAIKASLSKEISTGGSKEALEALMDYYLNKMEKVEILDKAVYVPQKVRETKEWLYRIIEDENL